MTEQLASKTGIEKWPDRIYLQRDYECAEEGCGPHNGDDGETTWCKDKIHSTDVEYVRADLSRASAEPPVALNEHPECRDLAHSELMRRLPNVPPHLLAEIQQLSPWALQRRVLIQADWLGSYSRCLDGLGLKEGVDTCWNPRDIRRAVENLRPSVPPSELLAILREAEKDMRSGVIRQQTLNDAARVLAVSDAEGEVK